METAKYGNDRTLYVARTKPDGLTADRMAMYRKGRLASVAPATSTWSTVGWNGGSWLPTNSSMAPRRPG